MLLQLQRVEVTQRGRTMSLQMLNPLAALVRYKYAWTLNISQEFDKSTISCR